MKELSLSNKILLWINCVVIFFQFIAYFAKFFSPEIFWPMAFAGMAFPFIVIVNILLSLVWVYKFKIQIIIPIISLILISGDFKKYVQFNPSDDKISEHSFKLLSFNVRVFDLYDWTHGHDTRDQIYGFIKEQNADIMCFQEYLNSTGEAYYNVTDTLNQIQGEGFSHIEYTTHISNYHFGMATFSKFPIVNKGIVNLTNANKNMCIYTDIKKDNDTMRVYNMHLASLHIKSIEYVLVDNVKTIDTEENMAKTDIIFTRLKDAFVIRSTQAEEIRKHIKSSPYPVIVVGDFNDTPSSYAYSEINTGLSDAFINSGKGLGISYNSSFPAFRIDYIFHADCFVSKNFKTHDVDLSDHFPLTCNVELSP